MKNSLLPRVFLAVIAIAWVAPCSYAGGERWIMAMTPERMAGENLVHVRFLGPDGTALESDAMKAMVVRERDCNSGRIFQMVKDYKMGFEPENKLVGIYLFPHAWKAGPLCFSIPGVGKAEKDLTAEGNRSRSFMLTVAP